MNDYTYVTVELTAKESDEPCNVNVLMLHETLLKLPAEKYLELYKLMSETLPHTKLF